MVNKHGLQRVPSVCKREVMMGFPRNYTVNYVVKSDCDKASTNNVRLSLIGNSWCVQVIAVLLGQLFSRLGWIPAISYTSVVEACRPGQHPLVHGYLARLPLNLPRGQSTLDPCILSQKLGNLVSIKGEDVMRQTVS